VSHLSRSASATGSRGSVLRQAMSAVSLRRSAFGGVNAPRGRLHRLPHAARARRAAPRIYQSLDRRLFPGHQIETSPVTWHRHSCLCSSRSKPHRQECLCYSLRAARWDRPKVQPLAEAGILSVVRLADRYLFFGLPIAHIKCVRNYTSARLQILQQFGAES